MPRQQQSSAMKKVLTELKRLGFEVNRSKSGVWKIVPPSTIEGPFYTTHGTESALHPMRRDFKSHNRRCYLPAQGSMLMNTRWNNFIKMSKKVREKKRLREKWKK